MKNFIRCSSDRLTFNLTSVFFSLATAGAILLSASAVEAVDTLAYSFEDGTNGFHPNGGGIAVTQDTIGATEGTQSLKVSLVAGATFVGALTPTIAPILLGSPPAVDHAHFDLTLPSVFPVPPATGFAVIGVTVFGSSQPDYPGGQLDGLSVQFFDFDPKFNNEEHVDGLAEGLHKDFRIDLTSATNPLTFEEHQTFSQIFGSGPNQVVPTGFQFYVNKSTSPITVYFDNVRFGLSVPGDYNGNDIVDTVDYCVWRDTFGSTADLRANGDNSGLSANKIDDADYEYWKSRYGAVMGSGSVSAGSVPEPTSGLLLITAAVCCYGARRVSAAR